MIKSWKDGGYTIGDEQGPSGEILIGGEHVAGGYFKHDNPCDKDSFFVDQNGMRWFRTGDVGRLIPPTNDLSIIDRKKQLVKLANGEYVSLGKIESALLELDWIESVCVITKPTEPKLVAVIVPDWSILQQQQKKEDETPLMSADNLEEILVDVISKELGDRLARYEVPKMIHLAKGPWTPDTGLVTSIMKVKRKAVMETYQEEITAMFMKIGQ